MSADSTGPATHIWQYQILAAYNSFLSATVFLFCFITKCLDFNKKKVNHVKIQYGIITDMLRCLALEVDGPAYSAEQK